MTSQSLQRFIALQQSISQEQEPQSKMIAVYQQIIEYLEATESYFLTDLSNYLHYQDFLMLFKQIQYRKCQFGTSIIIKGGKVNKGYILLNGKVEYHYHYDNSEITELISEAEPGHLICPDALVYRKGSSCSVKCSDQSQFLVISPQTYSKYIKKWLIRELDQHIETLKNTGLFAQVNEHILRKYSSFLLPKTFLYKEVIYDELDNADCIYLIENGEIELSIRQETDNKLETKNKLYDQTKTFFDVKLVKLNRGQFFGIRLLNDHLRREKAYCVSQRVKTLKMKKFIFEELWSESIVLRQNLEICLKKIQKVHESMATKNMKMKGSKTLTDNKLMKRRKKKKNKRNAGLQNIEWWGLAEKVKISEKYRIKGRSLQKICSRKFGINEEDFERISMEKKIDNLKKRILKGEIDEMQYEETMKDEQQNIGQCQFSPWNAAHFPKTRVKIKMLDVKPKAIDVAEVTKKKLLTYAKNMSNFCDRLNLQ